MLGAITGDIVGSIYEHRNIKTKEFPFFGHRCTFTDDTVCTVAVADCLMAGGDFADYLRRYVQRHPNRGYGGMFRRWALSESGPYNSWGNGSAMRVSPVAHVARDERELLDLAERSSSVTHDQLVKHYAAEHSVEAKRRYSPPQVVSVHHRHVSGRPHRASTSYVERSNLTIRMQQRRFTRLTNGFSKKLRNHRAAVALFVAHYNLCRVHETIRMTPAMALGVADHIWTIGELVEAATAPEKPEPEGERVGRFWVINGGKE